MNISLRTRLVLSFLVTIVLTVGLVTLLANLITRRRFTQLVSNTGERLAKKVAPIFAAYYAEKGGWGGVEDLLLAFRRRSEAAGALPTGLWREERLLLLDSQGRIVADSAPAAEAIKLPVEALNKGVPIIVRGTG